MSRSHSVRCDVCGKIVESEGKRACDWRIKEVTISVGVFPVLDFDICEQSPCLETFGRALKATIAEFHRKLEP